MFLSALDRILTTGLEAAFLELRPQLIRFLRGRGASQQIDDLVQELWFKATQMPRGPIANPRAYLFQCAHNLMIDLHRSDHQRAMREQAWTEIQMAEDGNESFTPSFERQVFARREIEALVKALEQLGEPTWSIFCRFRVSGERQATIAAGLGVSLTTVEKHLQKAYRFLAQWQNMSRGDVTSDGLLQEIEP